MASVAWKAARFGIGWGPARKLGSWAKDALIFAALADPPLAAIGETIIDVVPKLFSGPTPTDPWATAASTASFGPQASLGTTSVTVEPSSVPIRADAVGEGQRSLIVEKNRLDASRARRARVDAWAADSASEAPTVTAQSTAVPMIGSGIQSPTPRVAIPQVQQSEVAMTDASGMAVMPWGQQNISSLGMGFLSGNGPPEQLIAVRADGSQAVWVAGGVMFYRLINGQIAVKKKSGVWKLYRPQKMIVVSRNPRVKTLARAEKRINARVRELATMYARVSKKPKKR